MEWIWLILLVLLGAALIMIEVFLVPGTTVVGLSGVMVCGLAVYLTYDGQGTTAGHGMLAGTLALTTFLVYRGFKTKSWERYSLNDVLDKKINELEHEVKVGDKGKATSVIRPMGSAFINDHYYEVRSSFGYIESGTPVEVTKVNGNQIFVKIIEETDAK